MSTIKSPMEQTKIFDGQVEVPTDVPSDVKPAASEMKRVYRRRPLLVEARPNSDGSWAVVEAGRTIVVPRDEFSKLYEVLDVDSDGHVDVGLPDLEPGQTLEKDGKKYVRVVVNAGRGATAYWHGMAPSGEMCQWRVTADVIDNEQASHRVGRFVEPWEGKSGMRTWVEVR